jgi:hypothetical protein
MNNIFDIKRFGNYLLYDLRRARNNYGFSMLVVGLLPFIIFITTEFISLIIGNGVIILPDFAKFLSFVIACIIVIFSFGAKAYGELTGKQAGSSFLMLPASIPEKWLSLFLITCVAAPVALFALLFLSDGVLGLFFPNSYGDSVLRTTFTRDLLEGMTTLREEGVYINHFGILVIDWITNILTFTLGAICFKKAKVAKTLLCLFALAMILSTLFAILFGNGTVDPEQFFERFDSPERAISSFNWYLNITYTCTLAILLGGIFYRLRTIKH